MQQLSISFGVAAAGLTTVFFIPDRLHADAGAMIARPAPGLPGAGRLHHPVDVVFSRLKRDDGADETRQKDIHLG